MFSKLGKCWSQLYYTPRASFRQYTRTYTGGDIFFVVNRYRYTRNPMMLLSETTTPYHHKKWHTLY